MSEKSFRELDSGNMQAALIQFEDYLDNNHLYAFKNWINGIVWDGPNITRYWVDVTLKYPYDLMPEPRGGLRLTQMGAKITFTLSTERVPKKVEHPDDLDPSSRKPKEETKEIWLVNIRVPRRAIQDVEEDEYDEIDNSNPTEDTDEEEQSSESSIDQEQDFEDNSGDLDNAIDGGEL